jgi:hypothetical protein
MALRNQELNDLLAEFNKSKSKKKRQQLSERSNAVTAAIPALETMYRSLKVVNSLETGNTTDLESRQC